MENQFDEIKWENVLNILEKRFGKKPDLQSIIFLIGHRELGQLREKFSKEEKQDLIHVGVCVLMSQAGYYEYVSEDGHILNQYVEKKKWMVKRRKTSLKEKLLIILKICKTKT